METSRSKLRQFEKYVRNVFALPDLLANLTDKRRDPKISTFDVVNSLFHTAVLRIPSINALRKRASDRALTFVGTNPTGELISSGLPDSPSNGRGVTAITGHKTASDRPHYSMKQVRVFFATTRTSQRPTPPCGADGRSDLHERIGWLHQSAGGVLFSLAACIIR